MFKRLVLFVLTVLLSVHPALAEKSGVACYDAETLAFLQSGLNDSIKRVVRRLGLTNYTISKPTMIRVDGRISICVSINGKE